ncbi:hypothetical protein SD71_02890 [Cohnella kolymensis]|uniref:DUF1641 domain-containing protein n=1 Tax=Cohnella kolymensis TaxID=1590652 RepID=A0ABR5A979_9BACL|nr:DUF1641 domain-containing protein [Cohnella kolymensis]KIL37573.1 hypothetical protein SD71_02890 [Cohnella kolymensis]
MARPISEIEFTAHDPAVLEAQALGEILSAVAQHKKPLIQFMDIVHELHKFGILDALEALLKNRHQVGVIGIAQLNDSGMQHILKNVILATQFLGKVEPTSLDNMLKGVLSGMERAGGQVADSNNKPVGMFGMIRAMGDEDVRSALGFMLNFLTGMGSQIKQNNAQAQNSQGQKDGSGTHGTQHQHVH